MGDFRTNYVALAAADRAFAASTRLENVRRKHLDSAESWDRLAAAEIELQSKADTVNALDRFTGEYEWMPKTPI